MIYPNAQHRIDQRLHEGKQVGIVYHWTFETNAVEILQDMDLITHPLSTDWASKSDTRKLELYGVSLTRSSRPLASLRTKQVRFTIDGNALSNRYKIRPHSDLGHSQRVKGESEAEEFVIVVETPQDRPFRINMPVMKLKPGDILAVGVDEEFYDSDNKWQILDELRRWAAKRGAPLQVFNAASGRVVMEKV